jgi:2-phospho-L-lactate guanylyltransferase
MRTLAILPVKTFGAAKQRLAPALGSGSRRALARAMFADVLGALRRVDALDCLAVVTADPAALRRVDALDCLAVVTADPAARDAGVLVLPDTAEAGQSPAAAIGISHALAKGFDRVLLVPGDTPLVDPAEVESLLGAPRRVSIVPDRHGAGTNALVLTPPDAISPSFGPGSLKRHVAAASAAGVPAAVEEVPTLMLDVDTPADLSALRAALAERPDTAPATRRALHELDRQGHTAVPA